MYFCEDERTYLGSRLINTKCQVHAMHNKFFRNIAYTRYVELMLLCDKLGTHNSIKFTCFVGTLFQLV